MEHLKKIASFVILLIIILAWSEVNGINAAGVSGSITVGEGPLGLAYDSGKDEIFVANSDSNTVSVISDSNHTVIETVKVGKSPFGVAYDSGKGEIYVTNADSGTVSVISDTTHTVIATVNLGGTPVDVVYDRGKSEIFVVNKAMQNDTIQVISDNSNTVIAHTPFNREYSFNMLAYDSGKGEIYVSSGGSLVYVISDNSNTVIATLHLGGNTGGIVYDSGKSEIFVANHGFDTVQVISDKTYSVVANVTGGGGAGKIHYSPVRGFFELNLGGIGVAYDSGKGEIFVTNSQPDGSGIVTIISDSNNTVVANIPVEKDAWDIAYDSGKDEIYLTFPGSDSVYFIAAGEPYPSPYQSPSHSPQETETLPTVPVAAFSVVVAAVAVVSAVLLIYFKKHKPNTEIVKNPLTRTVLRLLKS